MGVDAQFASYAVQALALHNLGARGGEEALVFVGKVMIEIVGHDEVEDGVAQVFQALIVGPAAVGQLDGLGAVHEGELVGRNVVGIEPGDASYKNIKLLILDEKELYE